MADEKQRGGCKAEPAEADFGDAPGEGVGHGAGAFAGWLGRGWQ